MENQIDIEYKNEIWLFLEMITSRVMQLRKEYVQGHFKNAPINIVDLSNVKLEYFVDNFELDKSEQYTKLVYSLNNFQKLRKAQIGFLDKDFNVVCTAIYSREQKINNSIESEIAVSDNFIGSFRIQQEWGGSKWNGKMYKILGSKKNEFNASYFKEIGKFEIECLFDKENQHKY